jgi:DNA-binding NarL/FixJ family response regulator
LTPQEFKIAEKVKKGLSNKEIAKAMPLSPSTVKNHLSNIMRKLSVNKRSQLASIMSEHS